MPYLDRASFIELLGRLGVESDADALAAAREIDRRVKAAEVGWDDLLVLAPGAAPLGRLDDYDDPDADVSPFEINDRRCDHSFAEQEPIPPRQAQRYAAELKLIDTLLTRSSLAPETRRELLDLRADIAANDFAEMDGRYLRDLAVRLEGKA